MRIASYILNRFQKTGDLSSQTVWITVEEMKRSASWMSSKSERTHHVQHQSGAVTGRHAAGMGAMKRGEASGAGNLFSPDRFWQSREDRRAITFAFCEFYKIAIRKFFEKTKSRKPPENESRETKNETLKTRAQIAANRMTLCGPLPGSAWIGGRVRVSGPGRVAPCQ
jgi:hypothetical protein